MLVGVLGANLFTLPCTLLKIKIIEHFVLYIICTEVYSNRIKHVENMGKILFTTLSNEWFSLHQFSHKGECWHFCKELYQILWKFSLVASGWLQTDGRTDGRGLDVRLSLIRKERLKAADFTSYCRSKASVRGKHLPYRPHIPYSPATVRPSGLSLLRTWPVPLRNFLINVTVRRDFAGRCLERWRESKTRGAWHLS